MKRHAEVALSAWYSRENRKPLILRGARQVGKSTLVKNFAKLKELKLIEINLEKQKLLTLGKESLSMRSLIQEIEVISNISVDEKVLIFFDEIQEQPKLFSALRFFYEEYPQLAIICAGSLLEFALTSDQSVPVGRIEYYFLGPMKFSEFLEALGENILLRHFYNSSDFDENLHPRFLDLYKEFLFVGGMPEAVATYVRTKSLLEVRRVQRSILQTYQDDFVKYAKHSQVNRIRTIFNYVPGHLGQKIKYSEIDSSEKARDLKQALNLLIDAKILIPVYHTNATSLPLKATQDDSVFKLYFLDVGLANCLQSTSWQNIQQIDEFFVHRGAIAEQFIAQHLYYRIDGFETPDLFYWLRDKKSQNAEVDFVFNWLGGVTPVEVKSQASGRLKSLLLFMAEKKFPTAIKFDLTFFKSEFVEHKITSSGEKAVFELLTVPIYQVESIETAKLTF